MQNLTHMLMQKWGSTAVCGVTSRDSLLLTTSAMMAMLLVGCSDEGSEQNSVDDYEQTMKEVIVDVLENFQPEALQVELEGVSYDQQQLLITAEALINSGSNTLTVEDFDGSGSSATVTISYFPKTENIIQLDFTVKLQNDDNDTIQGTGALFWNNEVGPVVVNLSADSINNDLSDLLKKFNLNLLSSSDEIKAMLDDADGKKLSGEAMIEDIDSEGNLVQMEGKSILISSDEDDSFIFVVTNAENEIWEYPGRVVTNGGFVQFVDLIELDASNPQATFERVMNVYLQLKAAGVKMESFNSNGNEVEYFYYRDSQGLIVDIDIDSAMDRVGFQLREGYDTYIVNSLLSSNGIHYAELKIDDLNSVAGSFNASHYSLVKNVPQLSSDHKSSFESMMNAIVKLKTNEELDASPSLSYTDSNGIVATVEVHSDTGNIDFYLYESSDMSTIVDTFLPYETNYYAKLKDDMKLSELTTFTAKDYLVMTPSLDPDNLETSFASMLKTMINSDLLENDDGYTFTDSSGLSATLQKKASETTGETADTWLFSLSDEDRVFFDAIPYAEISEDKYTDPDLFEYDVSCYDESNADVPCNNLLWQGKYMTFTLGQVRSVDPNSSTVTLDLSANNVADFPDSGFYVAGDGGQEGAFSHGIKNGLSWEIVSLLLAAESTDYTKGVSIVYDPSPTANSVFIPMYGETVFRDSQVEGDTVSSYTISLPSIEVNGEHDTAGFRQIVIAPDDNGDGWRDVISSIDPIELYSQYKEKKAELYENQSLNCDQTADDHDSAPCFLADLTVVIDVIFTGIIQDTIDLFSTAGAVHFDQGDKITWEIDDAPDLVFGTTDYLISDDAAVEPNFYDDFSVWTDDDLEALVAELQGIDQEISLGGGVFAFTRPEMKIYEALAQNSDSAVAKISSFGDQVDAQDQGYQDALDSFGEELNTPTIFTYLYMHELMNEMIDDYFS